MTGTIGTPPDLDLLASFSELFQLVGFYGEVFYGSVGSWRSVRVR